MIKKHVKNRLLAEVLEWALSIAGAFIAFLIIRNFVFSGATVNGPSMEPTLYHNEKVIILKLPYLFGSPKRGDIIAFPYKENPSRYYVKRIIGMPGDIINIEGNRLIINGEPLNDEFSEGGLGAYGDVAFPITVPPDSYFVLGDNRSMSNDSRYTSVGCIPKKDITGKITLIYWPLDKIGLTQ